MNESLKIAVIFLVGLVVFSLAPQILHAQQADPVITVTVTASSATVNPGGTITLRGNATEAEPLTELTYQWTSSGGGTFSNPTSVSTSWTAPAASVPTVILVLTVTDDKGRISTASVSITVGNTVPTASATASSSSIAVGATITLTGTASDADVGDTLSYSWTSNGGGSFADNAALSTSWTAPTDSVAPVILTLTVTDGNGGVATASVTIQLTAAPAPEVSVTASSTLVEAGQTTVLDGTASGADVTYHWTSNGGGTFEDARSLDTTWTAPSTPGAATLTLTVTDNTVDADVSGSASVTVTVNAVDHPGEGVLLSMGIWGGVLQPHDRYVAVMYGAFERVQGEDALRSGTDKWLVTITTSDGTLLAGRTVPILGVNVVVFYLAPVDNAPLVAWEDPVLAAVTKNPLLFRTVEQRRPLVVSWIYSADATGQDQEGVVASLAAWLYEAAAGMEGFANRDEDLREIILETLGAEARLNFTAGELITAEGLHWLQRGYSQWYRLVPEIFSTRFTIGGNFSGEGEGPVRGDELQEQALESEFTTDVLALGSTFGLPPLIMGSGALLLLVIGILSLFHFLGGGVHHAIPYLGVAALAVALVGLLSFTVLAIVTVVLFLIAAAIMASKYTAS